MPCVRTQRGLAAAAIIVTLIVVVVVLVLGRSLFLPLVTLGQREVTDQRLRSVVESLASYVALNRYLPCPAQGNDLLVPNAEDIGKADPEGPTTAACNSPNGVVPWKTIGLRRDDGLDGWGRKLSYRVFSGNSGFTIPGGLNMTYCNASLGAPIDPMLGPDLFCKDGSPPPNSPGQFLAARGNMLVVQEDGGPRNGNAFVLISHGETGYGAFLAEIRDPAFARIAAPVSASEVANTQATGTYWNIARSAPDVLPTATNHFDDVVSYMSPDAVALKARLRARSWSNFSLSSEFSASSVEAAAPGFNAALSQNTGVTSLAMGGFMITASSSGTTRSIGFREQGGIGGIGVIGGSSTSGDLNSAFGERLTFQLGEGSEYGKVDVALNAFQITDNSPPTLRKERAEISFLKSGVTSQTTIVDAWHSQSSPSRCMIRLVSGGVFDRVDIAPVMQTNGGGSSRFTVAGIKACTDPTTPCAISISGAIDCSMLPPSAMTGSVIGIGTTTATLQGIVEDNGIAKGTGTGYVVPSSFFGHSVGTTSLPVTTGSGTILAGNCLTIAGDLTPESIPRKYLIVAGINAPGTVVIAEPGLVQSIPAFTTRNVTLAHCQTTVTFDYGDSLCYVSSAPGAPGVVDAGTGRTNVSASPVGLTCGTRYFYRTHATSLGGTSTGSNGSFMTAACPARPYSATTSAPSNVTGTSAILRGVVNDNGTATAVTFEYGLTACYQSSVSATPGTIAAGAGVTSVVAPITGLLCDTRYHYRVRTEGAGGTTTGDDIEFVTASCP